ncbi:MAG: uracil-DNA glycosylase [Betaproteobacteria bacterium]|nr:uracil-DNA glycosylase [Betaproteobacteria bacterium]
MKPEEARWRELGLWPLWVPKAALPATAPRRDGPAAPGEMPDRSPPVSAPTQELVSSAGWDELQTLVSQCSRCSLHETRKQAVFGVGNRQARWLFVGEGPGAEEDQRGEPFVGAAGKLLDQMLRAVGLNRAENVYIANVVKCRPPQNRTPTDLECASCMPYLQRQIELVQPTLIVALGKVAAHALLGMDKPLGALRGQDHRFGQIPLVVTWHPAYLLRNPADKAKTWEDLYRARQLMASLCTPRDGSADTADT